METKNLLSKLSKAILITLKIKKPTIIIKTKPKKQLKKVSKSNKTVKSTQTRKIKPKIVEQKSILPIKKVEISPKIPENKKPLSSNMPAPWSKVQKYKRIKKDDYYSRY